jgi:hypothetical protein
VVAVMAAVASGVDADQVPKSFVAADAAGRR